MKKGVRFPANGKMSVVIQVEEKKLRPGNRVKSTFAASFCNIA